MDNKKLITPQEALEFVENQLNIDLKKTRKKTNDMVFARTVFYYICREYLGIGSQKTGAFVNKDHATVLHSMKNILPQIKTINPYKRIIEKIDAMFSYEEIKNKQQDESFSLELTAYKVENDALSKENRDLKLKIIELQEKLDLIPENVEILDLLKRMPRTKKEDAENRMLKSLRLAYNA